MSCAVCSLTLSVSDADYYGAGPGSAIRGPSWPILAPAALIEQEKDKIEKNKAHAEVLRERIGQLA